MKKSLLFVLICSMLSVASYAVGPITGILSACVGSTSPLVDTPGGGMWVSSTTSVATVGSSGVVLGIAPGTTTISYISSGGTALAVFTVFALPADITGPSTVCVGSTITLADVTPGGVWSSTAPTIASVGSTSGIVSGLTAGVTNIYYTLTAGGCSKHKSVTVNPLPAPIGGSPTMCVGAFTTYTDATSGGTWTSGTPGIMTINASTGYATGISAGIVTIYYTAPGGCSVYRSVTVNNSPAAIVGSTRLCEGSVMTVTDPTPGGSWSSTSPTVASVGPTGLVTGLSAGFTYIVYTVGGCSALLSLTVGAMPAAITGPTTLCAGSTITLSDTSTGGTWSSSNMSVAYIDSVTGVLTGVGAGVVNITYTTGCFTVMTVTVNANPPAISGSNTVCMGASITLTDGASGGFWASSNPAVASVSSGGIVTGNSAGTATITYTLPTGCFITKLITVTTGSATISGSTTVCVGLYVTWSASPTGGSWTSGAPAIAVAGPTTGIIDGLSIGVATISYSIGGCVSTKNITVNAAPAAIAGGSSVCVGSTITLTDPTSGGSWSSSSPSVATVSSGGVVTGVSAGGVVITYSVGGCSVYKSVAVTSSPAAISGSSTVCTGSTITLTDATSGGSWSSSNTSVATISASGVVTGVSAGTAIITYSVGSCVVTKLITVTAGPAAIAGSSSVCVGSSITLTDAVSGGSWSSSSSSIATVSSGGVVTGVSAGGVVITYSVGGCSVYKTVAVTAGPAPITGSSTVCTGSTITLTDTTSGGVWSSGSTAIATVSASGVVTGVSTGVVTISYSVGGCIVTKVITVTAGPAPITGSSSTCAGSSITLADATAGGTWSSSNPSVATVSASGVVTGVAGGTVNIYYTVGGCSVAKTITITSALTGISGASTVCTGSSILLTDATAGGTWSSSAPSIATVGASTGAVTGVTVGVVNITYTAAGCTAYKSVTVTSAPAAISGSSTMCSGTTITLTDAVGGGVWTSGNAAIATVVSSTGVVTGVAAGVVNIYYNITGCGGTYKTVTVTASPAAIVGATSVCSGSSITMTDAVTGGVWSSSSTAVATVTTGGVVTGVSAGVVTISYTKGGCTVTKSVTVNASAAPISGSSTVCVGSSITLTDATAGGTWSSGGPSMATVGSSTGLVTGVAPGVVNIYYSVSGCAGAYKTVTVTAAPAAIAGSSTVCTGVSITLTDATSGGVWSSSSTAIATVSASGVVTGVSSGVVTISYSVGGGCVATKTITVSAGPKPITGGSTVCVGSSIFLSDSTPGGTWTSGSTAVATVSSGGVVTGVTPGVVNIYYSTAGCSGVYKVITVIAAPAAIAGPSGMCAGSSITLTDATAGGVWSSSNPSVATVSTAGVVSGVSAGVATITYTVGGSCSVTKVVSVSTAPAAIAGGSSVCIGATMTLTDATPGGAWSSGSPALATVGASTGLVTGLSAGTVIVYYTVGGCSVFKKITVTSCGKPAGADINAEGTGSINIFPNPAFGSVNINWENQVIGNAVISVTDVVGREVNRTVLNAENNSGTTKLNLSDLKEGIYTISIRSESVNFNSRILISQ